MSRAKNRTNLTQVPSGIYRSVDARTIKDIIHD